MKNRADSARVAYPLFHAEDGGSIPTSALQLFFATTQRDTFKTLNKQWHSRLPLIGGSVGRIYYKAEHEGLIYAVAMWSNPVARMLPQMEWMELRRLAIADDAPKNTASRFIAWMVRDIKKRFPEVVRLISYQDCDVHTGTIYKASGWVIGNVGERVDENAKYNNWKTRPGRINQSTAPKQRWEYRIR